MGWGVRGVQEEQAEVTPEVEDVVSLRPGHGEQRVKGGDLFCRLISQRRDFMVANGHEHRDKAAIRRAHLLFPRIEICLPAFHLLRIVAAARVGEVAAEDHEAGIEFAGQFIHRVQHGAVAVNVVAIYEPRWTAQVLGHGPELENALAWPKVEVVVGRRKQTRQLDCVHRSHAAGQRVTVASDGFPSVRGGGCAEVKLGFGLLLRLPMDRHGRGRVALPSQVKRGRIENSRGGAGTGRGPGTQPEGRENQSRTSTEQHPLSFREPDPRVRTFRRQHAGAEGSAKPRDANSQSDQPRDLTYNCDCLILQSHSRKERNRIRCYENSHS